MSETPPRCPKCGLVMCEQFDEKSIADTPYFNRVVVVPNGKFICYHCEQVKKEEQP